MGEAEITIDDRGLARPSGGARWDAAVHREIVQGIVDVESRALLSNLACLLLIVLAATTLPNAASYVVPVGLRILAMIGTRTTFARLRRALAANADYANALNHVLVALAFGGASWAAVLVPMVAEPFLNPGRMLVGGGVMVGISIVVSLLAPVPRMAAAFCAGFVLVFAIGMMDAPAAFAFRAGLGIAGLFAIFLSYGIATSSRHRKAAEMLVENQTLSEELAEALAHAEFLAYRDPLTGLLNRRAFFQCAEEHGGQIPRHVIAIDLDHFKAINDQYGHAFGDKVLVGVADAMKRVMAQLGSGDHCAVRLGGEEFAMVLSIADPKLAGTVAEMVRHAVALVANDLGEPALVTTASIGLCAWHPGQSLDEVLSHADRGLYRAKVQGRDRVVRMRARNRRA